MIWKTIIESRHMTATTLLTGLAPVHPGEILREDVLPALGKSKAEIARLLGTSRQSLYDLLAEKQGVTIPMALRLGKMCGNGGQFWFALQAPDKKDNGGEWNGEPNGIGVSNAPIGNPFARPLASVTRSGVIPSCS